MNPEEQMNVEELEGMAINLNSEFDRDKVEAWEYFCDIAPYLVRRVIAAEKLVDALHDVLKQEDDHWAGTRAALATYEATK